MTNPAPVPVPVPAAAGGVQSLPTSPSRFYPYTVDPGNPGRRLFDDAGVQRQLDAKVASLRPGSTWAIIAHGDSEENFTLSAVVKKGEHWTFAGVLDHSKDVKWRASAEVRVEG